MNQILVTEKLYITPELKRKKKIYKFNFFLSVFLVCSLMSVCIYAEYDRNKSEAVSQEILASANIQEDTTIAKSDVLVVVLNDVQEDEGDVEEGQQENEQPSAHQQASATQTNKKQTTANGFNYETIARISIPKINVDYVVLDGETKSVEETDALLKISPTKFWGPGPNEVGNFCIVGHNYRNTKFFSKVLNLINGDSIYITDLNGQKIEYSVYDKFEVIPDDLSCTTQLTNGRREITLITCTNDSKLRVIVKAVEVK